MEPDTARVEQHPSIGDTIAGVRASRSRSVIFVSATVVIVGHWVEHLAQVAQIHLLGWPPAESLGALGLVAPDLVRSEWLHWVYNLAVLVGTLLVLPHLTGRSRTWWRVGVFAQLWHFAEHGLLLAQALTGWRLLGGDVPRSLAQLFVPRVELHLLYNTIVTVFLLIAVDCARKDGRAARAAAGEERVPSLQAG